MRFRMLGPLLVRDGPDWVPVRAAKQRVLLAVLLADAGRVIETERLVYEVWGDRPPRTAVNTVHAYVMRLRRMLGDAAAGLLVTRGRGYQLVIGDGDVDAWQFERLAGAGRRALAGGEPERAVARLSEALALWRGPVLADVPESPSRAARVSQLEQTRLAAVEDQMSALLELGRDAEAVENLSRLVHEYPFRERLWGQLMLALHRSGRRAEALETYQRARQVLVAELGLEPGPQLRELQRTVLAEDVPRQAAVAAGPLVRVVPAQLPADVAEFVGRDEQLKQLDALLPGRGEAAGTVVVCAIAGAGGVGKTALAVHWAHRTRDRFPDGQLHVDLRGYALGPALRPIDALARFLSALGMPAEQIPTVEAEAAAAYRSLLSGKRMLILLDNARHPEQVRPLLPGGSGCLVLVTSRDQLAGLVARDGAVPLHLDVLTAAEAELLLYRLLGRDRADAEPREVAEVARLCGYWPLALRIAAAEHTTNPGRMVSDYVGRLRRDRLAALQVHGDPQAAVRAAFDLSYATLPAGTRRLFRLLGLVPGPDVTPAAAANLADLAPERAARLLDQLARAHLVSEPGPGRYALHDLIRIYAAGLAEAEDDAAGRAAAVDRLYAHYLQAVDAAADKLHPQIFRHPADLPGAVHPTAFDGRDEASAWLDAERVNLVAAVTHAAARGPSAAGWRLADGLRGYLYMRMSMVDWQVVAEAGLAAARTTGEARGEVTAHLSLGVMGWVGGRYRLAVEQYERALAIARDAGWVEAEGAALGNLGAAHWTLGDMRRAAEYQLRALEINRRIGRLGGQTTNLTNLGVTYAILGHLDLAIEYLQEGLTVGQQIGAYVGGNLGNLGEVYHQLGRLDDALATLTEVLELHRRLGDRHSEAVTVRALAAVHRDAGRYREAEVLADAALGVARDTGAQRAEADALIVVGTLHHHADRIGPAVRYHQQALDLARAIGNDYAEAEALIGLAGAGRRAGQLDAAVEHAGQALAVARQGGYQVVEGNATTAMAAIQLALGRPDAADDLAERAVTILRQTGHRLGEARAYLVAEQALHATGQAEPAREHNRLARVLFAAIGAPLDGHARATLGPPGQA